LFYERNLFVELFPEFFIHLFPVLSPARIIAPSSLLFPPKGLRFKLKHERQLFSISRHRAGRPPTFSASPIFPLTGPKKKNRL
ncbi:MAG: hypothetical protein ACXWL9_09895, partial [Syntrophales bacterium]